MRRGLLCLALLLGCRQPVEPPQPHHEARLRIGGERFAWIYDTVPVIRFDPPPIYGLWKQEAEQCTGKSKPGFPRLFLSPFGHVGVSSLAEYFAHHEAVVFSLGTEAQAWVVRHELIHWLGAPTDHPPELFDLVNGKCGALVNPLRN